MELTQKVEKIEQEIKKLKKQKKYLKKFLKYMWCEDKQEKLVKIDNQEIEKYKNEINSLNDKMKILTKEIVKKDETIKNLKLEITKFNDKLKEKDNKIKSLNKTISELKENPIKQIFSLYQNLNNETKKGLLNLLFGEDEFALLSSGIINFNDIWEYAKYLNDENEIEEFEILKQIVEILFDIVKTSKQLEKQDIEISQPFDMEIMNRDNKSTSQSGEVKEIILFGYTKNNDLVNKSVVRVG